jgi:hypothetical protein
MKPFLTLLLVTLCAATGYGQTMKALSFNTTNGVVAYSGTNTLQLPSAVKFGGDAGIVSSVLQFANEDRISLEERRFFGDWTFGGSITFEAAASVRTNVGLPLQALTNTSNVTTMRALSGSTNTNHPFSGSVSVVGTNNTNTLVFSNGILQSVQ